MIHVYSVCVCVCVIASIANFCASHVKESVIACNFFFEDFLQEIENFPTQVIDVQNLWLSV